MKHKNKADGQMIHAMRRARERYELDLNKQQYIDMIGYFHNRPNSRIFIGKISNRLSVHDLTFQEKVYRVVYDKIRRTIATFLPPNGDFTPAFLEEGMTEE